MLHTAIVEVAFDEPDTVNSMFSPKQMIESGGDNSIRISLKDYTPGKCLGLEEIVLLALSFPIGIATSYVASWLYEKLNQKAKYIRYKKYVYRVDREEIEMLIVEIKMTGTREQSAKVE